MVPCPECDGYKGFDKKRCWDCHVKSIKGVPKTHGMVYTSIYKRWASLKERCNTYDIPFQKSWRIFENFFKDMGNCESNWRLTRKDRKKGYNKDNCKWIKLIDVE